MTVESCVCMPAHPQNAFCNSDFVIKVTITSKRQYSLVKNYQQYIDMGLPPLQIAFYNITVMKIFKGQSNIQHLLREGTPPKAVVHTTPNEGANSCSLLLRKGGIYLLGGRLDREKMMLSKCDFNNEWHLLSEQIMNGVHGAYECHCTVATCVDGYCDYNSSCQWDVADECSSKYRMCGRSGSECSWISDDQYTKC